MIRGSNQYFLWLRISCQSCSRTCAFAMSECLLVHLFVVAPVSLACEVGSPVWLGRARGAMERISPENPPERADRHHAGEKDHPENPARLPKGERSAQS